MWNSGRCNEVDVGDGEALVGRADLAAPEAVGLGPHDRLGPRGRPGRVLDRRGRVVRDRPERLGGGSEGPEGMPVLAEVSDVEDVGSRHRRARGRSSRAGGDHGSRVAVAGDVVEVVSGRTRVEADRDRPHRRDGGPGHEQLGAVGQEQRDAVSSGDTARGEAGRERSYVGGELAPGPRERATLDRHPREERPARIDLGPPFDQPADIAAEAGDERPRCHSSGHCRCRTVKNSA